MGQPAQESAEPDRGGPPGDGEGRGRFESVYFAFGEYDIVFVMEAPDNTSAAAFALAVAAGGAVKAYKTTPLMTVEEGLEAIRAAGDVAAAYRPPAG